MGDVRSHRRENGVWPWVTVVVMVAGLSACGGGEAADPLTPYRTQTVNWSACDENILGSEEGARRFVRALGSRLQCAEVQAPKDWSQPELGDVSVAVTRLAAADLAQRRGAILYNPGGPGVDGRDTWLGVVGAFRLSNAASVQGAQQLKLLASYDMVGFSPRGTGGSTRSYCTITEPNRPVDSSPQGTSDANLANANLNAQSLAQACLRNPLTPYIHTDATARDMDLIRSLLGEDKLNYVGYSYGTWLGSWYASLFPGHVGRMVLDSSSDFSRPMVQSLIAKPRARQRIQDEVWLPYAVRHADTFGLGTNAREISQMLMGLPPDLQRVLGTTLSDASYSAALADEALEWMVAAQGLGEVLKVTGPADANAVQAQLSAHTFVPLHAERNQRARARAKVLYRSAYLAEAESESTPFSPVQTDGAFWSIRCNDSRSPTDPAAWMDLVREQAIMGPFYYGVVQMNPCLYWGGPRVTHPTVDALQKLDILMVQSEYDGATPTPDADSYFAQLPMARRIYIPGEYQHAVFPYQDDCVDVHVVAYLLGESPTQRQTDCRAKPLAQDAVVAGMQARSASEPTYNDPEEAARWIAQFKRSLVPPAGMH